MDKKLLELRNKANKKKPGFVVKESNFSARVKSRWRFPRGKHSKVRQMHCGRPALPGTGYGSPKEVRGLHPSGLEMVVVNNGKELESLDAQKQGAVISSNVGMKKRMGLLALALEKKIMVLNVKDPAKEIEMIKNNFEGRKKLKKEKLSLASKKEEEKKKKAEERKVKEEKEKAEKEKHQHDHDHGIEHGNGSKKDEGSKSSHSVRDVPSGTKEKELAEKVITKKK